MLEALASLDFSKLASRPCQVALLKPLPIKTSFFRGKLAEPRSWDRTGIKPWTAWLVVVVQCDDKWGDP